MNQCFPSAAASINNGMHVILKLHDENLTFEELSETLLTKILSENNFERIDVVFDVSSEKSIKQMERKVEVKIKEHHSSV